MKYQILIQHAILKKLFILSILFLSSTSLRAEHFYDFYIQDLDLSEYPFIKIEGGVLEIESGTLIAESVSFLENGKKVNIDVTFEQLQKNFQIITITYKTTLAIDAIRKFHLSYDLMGYHNGSEGQFFEYNPKKHKYIKEIDEYGEVYEEYTDRFNYINNILLNYKRNGLEKMYVLALNGLLVREKPETSSKVIVKLDFGALAEASIQQYGEEIKVTENENLQLHLEGKFRKINFEGREGYVFDGYLTTYSFFRLKDKQSSCYTIYDSQEQEENNQEYRIRLDQDEYGEFLLLKYTSIEKTYLIAQAIFKELNTLKITEQQEYGEIYNGWKHYKFDDDNFMFKLFKYRDFNEFGSQKIYFECY
ncbi:SH3 domain-containing protein [Cellulophaga baltica]|uniref:SH3 domain-containing protein n=1 Tax=Cellulophaga baltica TaxID=76594 RepID=UPI002493F953|nr:SH3 domain-containing protein [Cellulophaga baltica]